MLSINLFVLREGSVDGMTKGLCKPVDVGVWEKKKDKLFTNDWMNENESLHPYLWCRFQILIPAQDILQKWNKYTGINAGMLCLRKYCSTCELSLI